MERLLLKADVVIPVSSEPIRNGAVVVDGGRIVDIGTSDRIETDYPGLQKIRRPNSIILPGFVNAHTHLELSWTKGKIRDFKDFTGWLERLITLKAGGVNQDLVEDSMRAGIRDVIESGVTTVGEISSLDFDGREMLKGSGMRIIAFLELFDRISPRLSSLEFQSEDLYEERPFPHAPYSCGPELLEAVFTRTRKTSVATGIHLGESPDEVDFLKNLPNEFERKIFPLIKKETFKRPRADTPTLYINRFLRGKDVKLSAVHMVQVGDEDMEVIRSADIGIILCPRSNVLLGVGKPNLSRMLDHERVGLGTDGLSSNSDLDFFREIRFLHDIMVEQGIRQSARLAVYSATLGGARALFIEEKTGSLEIGKSADIICVDYEAQSAPDPYSCVVSSEPEDLQFSMVGGNFIYRKDSCVPSEH
ncbi:MAG: amidohydrolase family protein [Candidatus Dadabacteria bacterium]|nr:amidohydrolase family protein [Candidatus Dadabacteria bacterium]MDE0292053.1 amidohydrolase family protein [Candidatus Dadabacteria bacterium]MDE0476523.1 amidohydrolase family protein [Candidatus Dadabacteria bacterium]